MKAILSIAILTIAVVLSVGAPASGQEIDAESAVRHAFEHSPTLRAAALDLQAAEQALESAEAERTPTFSASVGGGHNESFGATVLGVAPRMSNQVEVDLGLDWTTRVGTGFGFELGGAWQPNEVNDDSGLNDSWESQYGVEGRLRMTQPLLRGAGRDVGEANERAARLSRTAAEHAQDDAASGLVRDVLKAYWETWYADATHELNQEAHDLAVQQLTDANARVTTLGTMSPIDALRFESELAGIEEDLSQSAADRRSRSVELGRLIGLAPAEAVDLTADDSAPLSDGLEMSVDEAIAMARENSSELRELEADYEQNLERVTLARDATLPRLDLTASLAVGTIWTNDAIGSRPAISGMVGLELELPVTTTRARANLSETRFRAESAEARLESRTRQLEAEAVNLVEQLQATRQRVELVERTVEVARQLADAEQQAMQLGTSTTMQVLEAQESLRRAELRYLRALVDLTKTSIELRHLTGQLLPQYASLAAEGN